MNSDITACELRKDFRNAIALKGVDLDVPESSIYALVGPNGAGKTTLIKTLMNILRPTFGRSEVLGVDSQKLAGQAFQRIGYVSENQEVPNWMTVERFLRFLKPFYPTWDSKLEVEMLARLHLPVDRTLGQLSRGMRMKAQLVSSLAYNPRLVVLDDSAVQVAFDAGRKSSPGDLPWHQQNPVGAMLKIPIRIEGLPVGTTLQCAAEQFTVKAAKTDELSIAWQRENEWDSQKSSLDRLRRQQAASGLGLRADIMNSAQRMEHLLSQIEPALNRRDAEEEKNIWIRPKLKFRNCNISSAADRTGCKNRIAATPTQPISNRVGPR
jgi:ABC-type lipoprotein export system ATPase subunit